MVGTGGKDGKCLLQPNFVPCSSSVFSQIAICFPELSNLRNIYCPGSLFILPRFILSLHPANFSGRFTNDFWGFG